MDIFVVISFYSTGHVQISLCVIFIKFFFNLFSLSLSISPSLFFYSLIIYFHCITYLSFPSLIFTIYNLSLDLSIYLSLCLTLSNYLFLFLSLSFFLSLSLSLSFSLSLSLPLPLTHSQFLFILYANPKPFIQKKRRTVK